MQSMARNSEVTEGGMTSRDSGKEILSPNIYYELPDRRGICHALLIQWQQFNCEKFPKLRVTTNGNRAYGAGPLVLYNLNRAPHWQNRVNFLSY